MISTRTLLALALAAASLPLLHAQNCCGTTTAPTQVAQVTKDPKGIQKATIVVNNGFKPSSLAVRAGSPVEITFDTKSRGCATSVIFKGLNLRKDLTNGKKTVVAFTPKKPGTYAFACPMDMIKGTLIVK